MKTAALEKWIEAGAADERTTDVAVRTLEGRLGAVLHYLPLAAKKADEDVEHVHQLRVWTRRAAAALQLYEPLLPKRRMLWLTKQLRRVRKAANNARDQDVLIARLKKKKSSGANKRWLESARAEREDAQKAIVDVQERLERDDRLKRRIDKLLARVHFRPEPADQALECFADWAPRCLRPVVDEFFASLPADRSDEAALHQFRIKGKELRYAMELLTGAFPESFRIELYPVIEGIQDQLGDINDLATGQARLQGKIEHASDAKDAASWKRLLTTEQKKLDEARQRFWQSVTPHKLQKLRGQFEAMLLAPAQRGGSPARRDGSPAQRDGRHGERKRATVQGRDGVLR
jgi:CHAD domain-containing protein